MTTKGLRIALDGPVGAGKSSVARRVAARLGLTYVDTGALYRCIALLALRKGLSPQDDAEAIVRLAQHALPDFDQPDESGIQRVFLSDEDVTEAIRTPEVTELASPISAIQGVRDALMALQREFARRGQVIMEGRDIQTVIMPDADLKIFLVASVEERARRRWLQYRDQGIDVALEELIEQVRARDTRDAGRANAPLAKADDAIEVDSDNLTEDEVVDRIVELARHRRSQADG